jgi:TPP-dependent pyruvate/acetoin dehydrogenase alpha subunit
MTYRFRGHVGPDDKIQGLHTDIRPEEEVTLWLDKDPIKVFKRYLLQHQLADEHILKVVNEEISQEVQAARDYAIGNPSPGREEIARYVFE